MLDTALLASIAQQVSVTWHHAVRFKDKVNNSFVAVLTRRHMIGNLCSNSHSALQKPSMS